MLLRYVILHHVDHPQEPDHFDLMFELEAGGPLATWRSALWPVSSCTAITRLADHRRAYLDYEGVISGNRGRVTRVASGHFTILEMRENGLELLLDGRDRLELSQRDSNTWIAEKRPPLE